MLDTFARRGALQVSDKQPRTTWNLASSFSFCLEPNGQLVARDAPSNLSVERGRYTESDGSFGWWAVWSDGWIEQGGMHYIYPEYVVNGDGTFTEVGTSNDWYRSIILKKSFYDQYSFCVLACGMNTNTRASDGTTFTSPHPSDYVAYVITKNSIGIGIDNPGTLHNGSAVQNNPTLKKVGVWWRAEGWAIRVDPETPNTFTVKFVDYNGAILKTQVVSKNGSATPPSSPTRTGYNFSGWSGSYTNVTQDQTVIATYTVISYTVKFYNNAAKTKLLWSETVNHGSTISKTIPAIDGLTADTWRLVSGSNAYGSGITGNTEYAASYKLTWSGKVDIDGGSGSSDYSYSTYIIGAANTIGTTTRYKDLGTDNYGFTIKITALSGNLKHSASPNHKLKWGINLDTDGLQAGASSWSDVHSETVVGTLVSEWRHTFVQEPLQTNSNATMNFSIAPTRSVDYSFYDSGYESDRLITNLTTDKSKDSKIRITMWAVKADSCTATWTLNVTNLVLEFT